MLLYIHIPFCDSRCHYCAFHTYDNKHALKARYAEALCIEWESALVRYNLPPQGIRSVFVGGGTPSTLPSTLYAPLFERIRPYLQSDAEITFEANPGSLTPQWLEGIRALGANRLSIGVQSFVRDKLRYLGRSHTPDEAHEAIMRASQAGFTQLSIDLMYGTPYDDWALELAQLRMLPLSHLSLYSLTIEADTPFAQRGEIPIEDPAQLRAIYADLHESGLPQYEISNFGTLCRHNLGYWQHLPYIGLGCGAVGFADAKRYYSAATLEAYLADPTAHSVETLDAQALLTEKLFLGWRCCVGVDSSLLQGPMRRRADLLVAEGKLRLDNGIYYNTDYLLADGVTLFVMG